MPAIAAVKTLLTDSNVPPEIASAVENAANGVQAWLSASATDIAGTIGIVFDDRAPRDVPDLLLHDGR